MKWIARALFVILVLASYAIAAAPYTGVDVSKMRGYTVYPNVTEADVKEAKAQGANTLRIMLMIHDLYTLKGYDQYPDPTLDHTKFMKIKNIVRLCRENGMTAIIDLHEMPGLVRWSGWKDFRLWDPIVGWRYQDLMINTWKQFATEFKNEPSGVVMFELFNEPEPKENDWNAPENKGSIWDNLQARLVTEIRRIDTVHTIIAAPPYGWRINAIEGWVPPKELLEDGKVAVTAHHYHPHDFTMQWDAWSDRTKKPSAYPGEYTGHIWPKAMWDKSRLKWVFEPVKKFQQAHPTIPFVVTEYSVMRIVPGAELWLRDSIDIMKSLNIGWTYHAFKEPDYLKDKKGCDDSLWDLDRPYPDPDGGFGKRLAEIKRGFAI